MASAPTYNIAIADDGLEKIYAVLASDATRIEYVGKASPGTLTSAKSWQIQKWTYDANGIVTNIKFAQGKADFIFDWDSKTTFF